VDADEPGIPVDDPARVDGNAQTWRGDLTVAGTAA
jgi:hypothetical protein